MPVIKSAIKKLRRDKKREKINDDFRQKLDKLIRDAKKKKSSASVVAAISIVDRAVKNNIIHKNRAARIKSSLSKLSKPAAKPQSLKTATTKKPSDKAKKPKSTTAKRSTKK